MEIGLKVGKRAEIGAWEMKTDFGGDNLSNGSRNLE